MNISRENIDELNAVIKISVEKEDYEKRVADVLKSYQKKANMPGFRPGKVPAGLIKKMYGNAVLVDEINKIVSENLSSYLSENDLNVLGEPLPNESQEPVDFDSQENFEFSFDIALSPDVEVKLTKREKLPFYKIEITDEMIDGHIKTLTSRFGKSEVVEQAGEESMIKGDIVEVDTDGNEVEGGIRAEDSVISTTVIKDDSEKEKIAGKKSGDSVIFDLRKAFPNDTEISYILKITKEQAAEVNGIYKFTIKEITEYQDPELNQELFDQLFGPGNVTSEDEMKVKVKEDLEKTFEMESEYRFATDAREKLLKKMDIPLPEEFLKRWVRVNNKNKEKEEEKVSEEQIENEFPSMLDDLRWQLIKNYIAKANDIKVEEADLKEFAKKSAKVQFMQYGLTNLPDEHLENYANEMLKNQDQARRMAEGVINEKVTEFIKDSIKVEEKEVSREEFNKLFDK
ncbi:trigger factor [Marinilabiliaceae bacterium ANBcel2]|nr:trigger factor [Marinilabiliaceae bacterium ANBcel2]